jgi:hypothetical protein
MKGRYDLSVLFEEYFLVCSETGIFLSLTGELWLGYLLILCGAAVLGEEEGVIRVFLLEGEIRL